MRKKLNIPEDLLRACLQEQYEISAVRLEFLPLGLDTRAGVYHVLCEHGDSYFLKVKSGSFYEASCLVPRYLRDQGITAVVAPLATKSHTLWTQVGDWRVIVYQFIAGDTGLHLGMTDENWQEVGAIFKQIHQVLLPPSGFQLLRQETFDPTEYARWARAFETQMAGSPGNNQVEYALLSCWIAHQPTIHTLLTYMEKLASVLQRETLPYVICHADLHANNVLRDPADHMFVIDWDDVMLAPKERDFIFVKGPEAGAFFQGYGRTEIDWVTLTYYQCERAVQDLIECAQEVFFRDDLGEESKADAAQLFSDLFAENNNVDAAFAAAAHLPSGLRFHNKEEA
ncbi:MAG TPA: aminoglycoside phosphotransferase family protein [Ktedonobacteraceae bacterium]|nr:aminoglycoside phosphotransferase family protein [Ktedonobacteraceae bacterium]